MKKRIDGTFGSSGLRKPPGEVPMEAIGVLPAPEARVHKILLEQSEEGRRHYRGILPEGCLPEVARRLLADVMARSYLYPLEDPVTQNREVLRPKHSTCTAYWDSMPSFLSCLGP